MTSAVTLAALYALIFTLFDLLVRSCGHKRFPMTAARAAEILRKVTL